jgi:ATP/maltotriose-dependent transcriptional regulator MalT
MVEIRRAHAAFRSGQLTKAEYECFLQIEIERAIGFQEEIGLDVLVHGEFERNDMVEYFGVLQLLAEGESNKKIASTLGISTYTAETHRSNIMQKLNLHSVSELTRYAIRNHLLGA